MPLEIYKRGNIWWVQGRIDGVERYIRESLGTRDPAVASAAAAEIERKARQRAVLGSDAPTEEDELTFAAAYLLYNAPRADAGYLKKILPEIGAMKLKDIRPIFIRDELAPRLYPSAACDTWRRQVIVPVSAVINNAHHLKGTPMIKIKGYTRAERVEQDQRRGKKSRQEKKPGSWEWLLKFTEEALESNLPYQAAIAWFMFTTGARISQCCEMTPDDNLKLREGKAIIPAAKGHDEREVDLMPEVVVMLANLPPRNGLVFGYASRSSVYGPWTAICERAKIDRIMPHAAGRHGFGTEMLTRQGVDTASAASVGGWSSKRVMTDVYQHGDESSLKVRDAFRRGLEAARTKLVQTESSTNIKRLKSK